MTTEPIGPYVQLLRSVHRADLLSRRVADRELAAQIGASRASFLVLEILTDSDVAGLSQQAVADRLGMTKAALSRHIGIASASGWVEVQPSSMSRRENSVTLTPAGRRLVEAGRRRRAQSERDAEQALGAEDLTRAAATLDRLCAWLEERLRSRTAADD